MLASITVTDWLAVAKPGAVAVIKATWSPSVTPSSTVAIVNVTEF